VRAIVDASGADVADPVGTAGGGDVGRAQSPQRARISFRASSSVTAPTTAMIAASGRTCSA